MQFDNLGCFLPWQFAIWWRRVRVVVKGVTLLQRHATTAISSEKQHAKTRRKKKRVHFLETAFLQSGTFLSKPTKNDKTMTLHQCHAYTEGVGISRICRSQKVWRVFSSFAEIWHAQKIFLQAWWKNEIKVAALCRYRKFFMSESSSTFYIIVCSNRSMEMSIRGKWKIHRYVHRQTQQYAPTS